MKKEEKTKQRIELIKDTIPEEKKKDIEWIFKEENKEK